MKDVSRTSVQGFQGNERRVNSSSIDDASQAVRGHYLDEVQLSVTIRSKKDLGRLISFIGSMAPCFESPTKQ